MVTAIRGLLDGVDPDDPPPKWMAALSSMTPNRALLIGGATALISVKMWVFTLAAIGAIGDAGMPLSANFATYITFVLLGVSTHLTIIAVAAFLLAPALHPERPRRLLRALCAGAAAVAALVAYTYFRRHMFPVGAPELLEAAHVDASLGERAFHKFMVWFRQPKLPSDPMNNPLIQADFAHRVAGGLRVYFRGLAWCAM